MSRKTTEIAEIHQAYDDLIDQLDHYFKDASDFDAIRLKLSVIHKLEATIRYDRNVHEKKEKFQVREDQKAFEKKNKFTQYKLPL